MDKEKSFLRKKMKSVMTELGFTYVTDADLRIMDHVLDSDLYKNASTIFTFITMGREIDMKPIISDAINRGKTVCGPKCFKDRHMEARKIRGLHDVINGFMNIPEPKDKCPIVMKEDIDLVLVPCLAADRGGYRLGYGAGYYDRYLKSYTGDSLLLCREKQLLVTVPIEPHDIRTDYYVTESGLFRSDS